MALFYTLRVHGDSDIRWRPLPDGKEYWQEDEAFHFRTLNIPRMKEILKTFVPEIDHPQKKHCVLLMQASINEALKELCAYETRGSSGPISIEEGRNQSVSISTSWYPDEEDFSD